MKHSELLNWAMRGIIEEKLQEQDEERKKELEQMLNQLAFELAVAIQKEKR